MAELGVTIAGEPFDHFVLTDPNREAGTICFGESFESPCEGLQHPLWELEVSPRGIAPTA